jgi:hypothetical protein
MQAEIIDNALGVAGTAYVVAAASEQPIPPNGFSYSGIRAAVRAYAEQMDLRALLVEIFEEGVQLGDDEHFDGKTDGTREEAAQEALEKLGLIDDA